MLIHRITRETPGVKDHVVKKKVSQSDKGFRIELDVWKGRRLPCSGCGTRSRVRDRLKSRTWKHVPWWGIPVIKTDAGLRLESSSA